MDDSMSIFLFNNWWINCDNVLDENYDVVNELWGRVGGGGELC